MCGGPTTKDSAPPPDTGAPTNSHNKDSSSKELSNTPLPIQRHRLLRLGPDAHVERARAGRRRRVQGRRRTRRNGQKIAAEANQKADKANEISERALTVGSDQTVYHCRCAYDGDAGKVVVVNESPNKATDVTVVFRFQDVTLADARQDVVAGLGELALDAPLAADYLARDAAELRRAAAAEG